MKQREKNMSLALNLDSIAIIRHLSKKKKDLGDFPLVLKNTNN